MQYLFQTKKSMFLKSDLNYFINLNLLLIYLYFILILKVSTSSQFNRVKIQFSNISTIYTILSKLVFFHTSEYPHDKSWQQTKLLQKM